MSACDCRCAGDVYGSLGRYPWRPNDVVWCAADDPEARDLLGEQLAMDRRERGHRREHGRAVGVDDEAGAIAAGEVVVDEPLRGVLREAELRRGYPSGNLSRRWTLTDRLPRARTARNAPLRFFVRVGGVEHVHNKTLNRSTPARKPGQAFGRG